MPKCQHLPNSSSQASYLAMRKTPPTLVVQAQEPFLVRIPGALLGAFNTNNRINHYLIDNVPAAAWKAKPPDGKGRTIPAVVAHMHNVRVMWLKVSAKDGTIPEQLDRAKVTPTQALRALEQSRQALCVLISRALESD